MQLYTCTMYIVWFFVFFLFSELLAVTIATEETDGFRRYVYSAEKYGINHKVLKSKNPKNQSEINTI